MSHQNVLILDFGGQYNQLIARRVRDLGVYCEILPFRKATVEKIQEYSPIGLIFTGGPNSVYAENAPKIDPQIFELGIPVLGLCYGCQLIAHTLGGKVETAPSREFGKTVTHFDTTSPLFQDLPEQAVTWMSHVDYVDKLPEGFVSIAHTEHCPVAAMQNLERKIFGFQYHPEVEHTENGSKMLRNFLYNVCGANGDWSMKDYCNTAIAQVREKVGDGKVLLALSGGVDSSVVAKLLSKAIGSQLTCIFVDHGLMRKNEGDEIEAVFGNGDINFVRVNAEDRFLSKLAGVSEPEKKRKIIGEEFIRVFEEEAKKIGKVDFLAQGTIYPDVVESGLGGESTVIKSHHNVGGLPDTVDFKELVEPLRNLFKDEVRQAGRELGLPEYLVSRQPFPGPGLGVRCLGAITRDRLEAVRESDAILREEFAKAGLEGKVWQYFTIVPDFKSVGVHEGVRTFDWPVILRAVNTVDAMTATVEDVPFALLQKITQRITSEVKGVNRVLYDLTPKPSGTIEWE